MPNHRHKKTEELSRQVETMSAMGLTLQMIEMITGVNHNTIYKYYKQELMVGKSKANLKVAQRVFELATNPEVAENVSLNACMFWLKTQAGWRERLDVDVSGEVNHNTTIQVNFIGAHAIKQAGNNILPERSVPPAIQNNTDSKESELWQPTFVGKHH